MLEKGSLLYSLPSRGNYVELYASVFVDPAPGVIICKQNIANQNTSREKYALRSFS